MVKNYFLTIAFPTNLSDFLLKSAPSHSAQY